MLVIEVGSYQHKAILGLSESLQPPSHRFDSVVARKTEDGVYICGKAAMKELQESAVSHTLVRPVVAGEVRDWDALEALWRNILQTVLGSSYHARSKAALYPVMLLHPPQWSPLDREKATQLFFERFSVPAFMLADSALASLYACNSLSGTVIDIGYEKTDVSTVFESQINNSCRTTCPVGGKHLSEHLRSMLEHELPVDQAAQKTIDVERVTLELAEFIKCSEICEVLPDTGVLDTKAYHSMTQSTGPSSSDEGVIDIAAVVASGKTREYLARKELEKSGDGGKAQEVIANAKLSHNSITVKDGSTLVIGQCRFKAAEPLLETGGLLDQIYDAIVNVSIEPSRRHELWENIVIVGGGSRVPGLREKLIASLQARYMSPITNPLDQYGPTLNPYPTIIRAIKIPIHFPYWTNKDDEDKHAVPEEASFLGASIMAHVAFADQAHSSISQRNFISRSEYDEYGPASVIL